MGLVLLGDRTVLKKTLDALLQSPETSTLLRLLEGVLVGRLFAVVYKDLGF